VSRALEIADQALAAAVQRERQFVLGMVVPLEGNAVAQSPVEHGDGRQIVHPDLFECRFHAIPAGDDARIVSEES